MGVSVAETLTVGVRDAVRDNVGVPEALVEGEDDADSVTLSVWEGDGATEGVAVRLRDADRDGLSVAECVLDGVRDPANTPS